MGHTAHDFQNLRHIPACIIYNFALADFWEKHKTVHYLDELPLSEQNEHARIYGFDSIIAQLADWDRLDAEAPARELEQQMQNMVANLVEGLRDGAILSMLSGDARDYVAHLMEIAENY